MNSVSISGFTFIRNGTMLGYPFVESIRSLLPLVDEFVVAVGRSSDDTLARVHAIGSPKIRVIETVWNEGMHDRGFVYAQQKMIAQYACTGDWAFYLEGDEIVHEDELDAIRASVDFHHGNRAVEALVFDYLHFYGSPKYVLASPGWYRRECRLIRNTIRTYAPDGQYWLVTQHHKRPRNPFGALANAHIYHYGWVRRAELMQAKIDQVAKYWRDAVPHKLDYSNVDRKALTPFQGAHPRVMTHWLANQAEQTLAFNPHYRLTAKERKYRLSKAIEKLTGLDFSRKHFKLVV
jgi:glycosyltransferase involved in cell wall biosynthesis